MLTFSESRAKIALALLAVQGRMQPVKRDRENPHFGHKYATLESITDTVRPILSEANLSIIQTVGRDNGALVVSTMLLHESGEWVQNTVHIPLGEKSNPQTAGSAITYGRRYGLSALLAITTDEDDDGERASTSRPAAKRSPAERKLAADAGRSDTPQSLSEKSYEPGVVPFPQMEKYIEWAGRPLSEVPTDALEACFREASRRTDKKFRNLVRAIEAVLEGRRA